MLSPLEFNHYWVDSGAYFIELDVGTPPQTLEVLVDTGSSDLFFPASNATPCVKGNCPGGRFNPSDSSSFEKEPKAPSFYSAYADGSQESGFFANDHIAVGATTLENVTFGVASSVQVSPGIKNGPQNGIMGVSYIDGQNAPYGRNLSFEYPTIPKALYDSGDAASYSYSLYLNSNEDDNGSMLFGGVDTAKFVGELKTLAVVDPSSTNLQIDLVSLMTAYKSENRYVREWMC